MSTFGKPREPREEHGRSVENQRKLEDGGNAGDDHEAEMPPLERKKTAAPLRIELRAFNLAHKGPMAVWVWECGGVGRKWQTNKRRPPSHLCVRPRPRSRCCRRRRRRRRRPGADKKNCQSALKVCNASKVSCKIDKYNADRQLLQFFFCCCCCCSSCCYCNNNIDSAF